MPRRASKSRDDAVAAITETFREHGFEGASLSRLSEASGLGRSSLYHYFPKGKEDMAAAALDRVGKIFGAEVIAPLRGDDPPAIRLGKALAAIERFYAGGEKACLIEHFGMSDAAAAAPGVAKAHTEALIGAFAATSRAAGFPAADAKLRAEQAVVEIEGALVVARALGTKKPFTRALARLPEILLGA